MNSKRIKINGGTGTVITNPYRHYNNGKVDRYYDVLMDDTGHIEPVRVESIEVI